MPISAENYFVRAAVAILLAAGLAAAPVAFAQKKLKIAILAPEEDEDFDGSMVFKNYVESASNGAS